MIAALVLGIFSVGYTQLKEMPVDTLPDFAPVYVEVQTESLGLSAIEVEQLITAPMEQLLLNGVPWLDEISSESIPGLSSIVMVFEPGTDPLEARQVVQERLSQGRDLPKVAKAPVMLQPLSSTSRVMMVRVDSDELSPIEQSVLAKWTIKPALMGVEGVANVAIWGQREQQMQVQIDPERLAAHDVDVQQVLKSTANSLWVSPLSFVEASTPGTGGFIDTPNQRLGIHHVLPITEPRDLAGVALEGPNGEQVLGRDGRPVLLGDVVDVVQDHQPLIGDAVAGESQGLMLVVEKFPEANTLEVTEGVEATLAELSPGLEGIEFTTDVFRPASYLDLAKTNLAWVAALGLALLVLLLGLLHSWRVAVAAAVSIPLSLTAAVLVLELRDATFNSMLVAGLAVGVAALVDDAVVDADRIWRRLREAGPTADRRSVVLAAIRTTRRPAVFATLVMVAATGPAFYLGLRGGLDRDLYTAAVVPYVLALAASLATAVLVTPVLMWALTPRGVTKAAPAPLGRRLDSAYGSRLPHGLHRPLTLLSAFAAIVVAGLLLTPALETDMRPSLKERTLLVHWEAAPGTSHPEMSRITGRVADELRALPGVAQVGAHVGRALSSDQVSSVNSGELWASLTDDADYDETMSSVREVVAGYPGIAQEVLTYTDERTAAHGIGTRVPDDVVIRVFGQEYDVLAEKAEQVRRALAGIDGARDVTIVATPQEPLVDVEVDLAVAQRYGLTPGEVRRAAATLVSGIEVGNLFERQKVFEVMVIGHPAVRHDLGVVEDLMIDTPRGGEVRLGDVADVKLVAAPTTVRHSGVSRYVDVVADVAGRDVSDVAADAERAVAGLDFPLEYHAELLGEQAEEEQRLVEALGLTGACLLAMLLLFQAFLRSWRLAMVAMLGLPLAASGALLVMVLAGLELTMGTLLALLVVTALYSRHLMLLYGRYDELVEQEGHRPDIALVTAGARERFLPVVAVSLGTLAFLLPTVAAGPRPGLELLQPMAVAVLGGLVTTMFVSLFLLPLLYLRIRPDTAAQAVDIDVHSHPAQPLVPVR